MLTRKIDDWEADRALHMFDYLLLHALGVIAVNSNRQQQCDEPKSHFASVLMFRILPTGDYRRQHRQPTCGTSVLTPKQNDFKLYFGMGDYGPRPE